MTSPADFHMEISWKILHYIYRVIHSFTASKGQSPELKSEVRRLHDLGLHLLGSAACRARLRFQLVRADDTLARLRFAPLQGAPEIWYRRASQGQ